MDKKRKAEDKRSRREERKASAGVSPVNHHESELLGANEDADIASADSGDNDTRAGA